MPLWPDLQGAFARAVRRPDVPTPDAIAPTGGRPSDRRFAVYRNNVASGLIDALASTFPVVAALIGGPRFRSLARAYSRASLPPTPVLADYGGDFADFIESFEPLRDLPFLGDVARLEWVWLRAYHAADAEPLAIASLGRVDEAELPELRLDLHPSLAILRSSFPVASIWHAHQQADVRAALATLPQAGEDVSVARPRLEVEVRRLSPGVATFISGLAGGLGLGAAADRAASAVPDFDLSAGIGGLFKAGLVVGVATAKPEH